MRIISIRIISLNIIQTHNILVNVERHFELLPTCYLYFNCSKFPKNVDELEINKKKLCEACESKSRKR